MKNKNFSMLVNVVVLFSAAALLGQDYPHNPAPHNHDNGSTGNCWGYAAARAFGRTDNDSRCAAKSAYSTTGSGTIPDQFFGEPQSWDIDDIIVGDIIRFGGNTHVAYVAIINSRTESGIVLHQVENLGGKHTTDLTLQDTIYGNGIGAQGQPTGYWRKIVAFKMELKNKLGDGTDGGKIGFEGEEPDSPYTTPTLHWESTHNLDAVMEGETHEGYIQRFDRWENDGGTAFPNKYWQNKKVDWNSTATETFVAEFNNEYNITARNSFTGISGYPGTIKVDGNTENSPHTEQVTDGSSIEIQALSHTINHIIYNFDEWLDGTQTATRTESPTDHETYTAEFTGKPKQMSDYNLYVSSTPGQYIQFSWNQHGNSNVQYRVYRRVKPQGGSLGPPVLKATLSHSTTSWTDYDYLMTSSYTEDLLQYDVRAYYTTESTEADPDFITVFGDGGLIPKQADPDGAWAFTAGVRPEHFAISAHPNPFNPSTNISYALPERATVTVQIFDAGGKLVTSLVQAEREPGFYGLRWHGDNQSGARVNSGLYFYRLIAKPLFGKETAIKTGKLLLAK